MEEVINVVGAAIVRDSRLFCARRSYGSEYVVHKYEFVGGKVERGEDPSAALVRECREELDTEVRVVRPVGESCYNYPDRSVNLKVYLCEMLSGYTVKEHEEASWVPFGELKSDDWAPADRDIVELLKEQLTPYYALITGATGHIGRAFCERLAALNENLFLTGRSMEKLAALKAELSAKYPGIKIVYSACDLSSERSRAQFFDDAFGYTFSRLINVAGADIQKAFLKYDERKIIFQSRALFEGAVSLTRFCLSSRAPEFSVINISSVSGIYPMPYFAIYSALKGALTSFSLALAEELKAQGVRVCAVLPGSVYSRPDVVEYIKKQGLWGRIAAKSPEFIAKKSLRAAARGRRKYIPGLANKLMRAFTSFVPQRLKLKFIARRWSRTEKDAFQL